MDAPWVFAALWKVTALFALGAAGAGLLRRAPARTRYALWAGVLAGAALLPALGRWMPSVHVPLWTWSPAPATTAAAELAAPEARAAVPALPRRARPTPAPTPAPALPELSAGDVALALWLCGAALALARLALGIRRARALAARATRLDDPEWRRHADALRRQLPTLPAVRLCASDEIAAPATFGVLRPVVLLPRAALAWSPERRRVVLAHELVHVARRDWAVQVLGQLVRAVYWFHPLAHVAAHRLAAERERACDERVIALGTAPSDYASHLLAIALALPRRGALSAALAMAHRSPKAQLEGRIMSILEERRATRASRSLARALVGTVLLSVPALAAIQPWAAPAHDPAHADTACCCAVHAHAPAPAPAPRSDGLHVEERTAAVTQLEQALRSAQELLAEQIDRVRALQAELEGLRSSGLRPSWPQPHGQHPLKLQQQWKVAREQADARSAEARAHFERALELERRFAQPRHPLLERGDGSGERWPTWSVGPDSAEEQADDAAAPDRLREQLYLRQRDSADETELRSLEQRLRREETSSRQRDDAQRAYEAAERAAERARLQWLEAGEAQVDVAREHFDRARALGAEKRLRGLHTDGGEGAERAEGARRPGLPRPPAELH